MTELIKWSIFILFSIGIIVFFWKSLEQVYSHGFFRFLAFEAIMGLLVVNSSYWLTDPFSYLQIGSWILLGGALITAIYGLYLLRITGKTMLPIDNTSLMSKVSVYKYFRHPFYWALLLLALGTFLKQISILSISILVVAIVFLVITVKVEEQEIKRNSGLNILSTHK